MTLRRTTEKIYVNETGPPVPGQKPSKICLPPGLHCDPKNNMLFRAMISFGHLI
jgi:hypothetical protein